MASGRYRACISSNYKSIHLGMYDTPEQAAIAYDARAKEIHGNFAWLNFPERARKALEGTK